MQTRDRVGRRRLALLDGFYPAPDWRWPLFEGTARRFLNLDLDGMDRDELRREQAWLTLRLRMDPKPDPWLTARHGAIREQLQAVGRG